MRPGPQPARCLGLGGAGGCNERFRRYPWTIANSVTRQIPCPVDRSDLLRPPPAWRPSASGCARPGCAPFKFGLPTAGRPILPRSAAVRRAPSPPAIPPAMKSWTSSLRSTNGRSRNAARPIRGRRHGRRHRLAATPARRAERPFAELPSVEICPLTSMLRDCCSICPTPRSTGARARKSATRFRARS